MFSKLVPALALACGATLVAAGPVAAGPAPAPAPAQAQAAPYAVTLAASRTSVEQGQRVVLTGKVRPRAAGEKVVVEVRYGGHRTWRKTGTAKVKRTGRYRFVDTIQTARSRAYRVVKPAGDGLRRGTSRQVEVTVHAWQDLGGRTPSAESGTQVEHGVPINGVTHRTAILGETTSRASYLEYTLGRRCTQLRTTIGLTDRTPSGGTGTVAISADGTSLFSQAFGLGSSVDQVLAVGGVYRLRVDLTQTSATVTEPALGTAQVLCAVE